MGVTQIYEVGASSSIDISKDRVERLDGEADITTLPDEVLEIVVSYLSVRDMCRFSRTCIRHCYIVYAHMRALNPNTNERKNVKYLFETGKDMKTFNSFMQYRYGGFQIKPDLSWLASAGFAELFRFCCLDQQVNRKHIFQIPLNEGDGNIFGYSPDLLKWDSELLVILAGAIHPGITCTVPLFVGDLVLPCSGNLDLFMYLCKHGMVRLRCIGIADPALARHFTLAMPINVQAIESGHSQHVLDTAPFLASRVPQIRLVGSLTLIPRDLQVFATKVVVDNVLMDPEVAQSFYHVLTHNAPDLKDLTLSAITLGPIDSLQLEVETLTLKDVEFTGESHQLPHATKSLKLLYPNSSIRGNILSSVMLESRGVTEFEIHMPFDSNIVEHFCYLTEVNRATIVIQPSGVDNYLQVLMDGIAKMPAMWHLELKVPFVPQLANHICTMVNQLKRLKRLVLRVFDSVDQHLYTPTYLSAVTHNSILEVRIVMDDVLYAYSRRTRDEVFSVVNYP
jgi:hypothetical protein